MNKDMREYIESGLMSLYDGMQGYASSLEIVRTEFHEVGVTYYLNIDSDTVQHKDMKDSINNRVNILKELNMFNLIPLQSIVSFSKAKDLWEVTIAPNFKDIPSDNPALDAFIKLTNVTNLDKHCEICFSFEEVKGNEKIVRANFEWFKLDREGDIPEEEREVKYAIKSFTMGTVKQLITESIIDVNGLIDFGDCDHAIAGSFYGEVIGDFTIGWDIAILNIPQKIKMWLVSSYV